MVAVPVRTMEAFQPGPLARLARAVCPACGGARAVRSRRRTTVDHLLSVIGLRPFRCESCRWRFYAWPELRLLALPLRAPDSRTGVPRQKHSGLSSGPD